MKKKHVYALGALLLVVVTLLLGMHLITGGRIAAADVEISSLEISPTGYLSIDTSELIAHGYYTTAVLYDGAGGFKDFSAVSGDLTPFGGSSKGSQGSTWPMERDHTMNPDLDWNALVRVEQGKVYRVSASSPLILFEYINERGEKQKATIELRRQPSRIF